MKHVKLTGGPFDGLEGETSDKAVEVGMCLMVLCGEHGEEPCECDDAMYYGYFLDGKNGLKFEVIG